jgi:hypothetical protein
MKKLAMCLALVLAACGVDAADPGDDAAPTSSSESELSAPAPAVIPPARCAPQSPGLCANAAFGTTCRLSPRLSCLPADELPDGEILCNCQSQSTI